MKTMQMTENILFLELKKYKKKYFINQILKGSLLIIGILVALYTTINIAEYYSHFNSIIRAGLFLSFTGAGVYLIYKYICIPTYKLATLNSSLSDKAAAEDIGNYFPSIDDKLINFIQLNSLSDSNNELVVASLNQKSKELGIHKFSEAINYQENKKYLKYAIPPLAFLFTGLLYIPQLFSESTTRIIQFDKKFAPKAPFKFILGTKDLHSFYNDDILIKLNLKGESMPDQAYIVVNGRKIKMQKINEEEYSFTIQKIQKNSNFWFEAAGFHSDEYDIDVKRKPSIESFTIQLNYPSYLHKATEKLDNTGNLSLPEGTKLKWLINGIATESVQIKLDNNSILKGEKNNSSFELEYTAKNSVNYDIELTGNKLNEKASFKLDVLPDKFPEVTIETYKDSTLYNYIIIGGQANDDYGLSKAELHYKIGKSNKYNTLPITINKNQLTQSIYINWSLDSIKLKEGEKIDYFVKVWDNDGVNGAKSSISKSFEFKLPSKDVLEKEVEKEAKKSEEKIDKTLDKAQSLKQEMDKLQQKLKGKKNYNWEDKKAIEELIKKHEELKNQLDDMKEQNKSSMEKDKRFKEENERIAEKSEQLQKLISEVLDEETKKILDELKKLLEEKNREGEIQDLLEKLDHKDQNTEKELERALEMFKKLQFDKKLENTIDKLNELKEKQEELAKETENTKKADLDKQNEKQNELNKEFDNVKKELDKLDELNKELEDKKNLESTKEDEKQIDEQMKNASEELKKENSGKAGKSQKSAADKMKKMADKLAAMKETMESEQQAENIEDLRKILENLLKLSFDQEALMKELKQTNQSDPRFIKLSQEQIKLQDNTKVIEDSLYALAKREPKIASFVTREMSSLKEYMQESITAIKQRRPDIATGKQQYTMTTANNLALLLNDALQSMQAEMKSQKSGKSGSCKKPGKKPGNKPSLSQMQKSLNKQMEELGKQGKGSKGGKPMSEELAKMAAQQERIRKAVKEMEKGNKDGQQSGGGLGKLKNDMEKTETDIVNKNITQETIKRQQEILTRLLEAEKSERERELDKKRESEQAKPKEVKIPASFEKYLKEKEQQIELLKTISPNLTPYYKREVSEYFDKIKE